MINASYSSAASDVTVDGIRALYWGMLGRYPESQSVIDTYMTMSMEQAANFISQSREYLDRLAIKEPSPVFQYFAMFDAEGVMRKHAVSNIVPDPKYLTNFLGVKIDPTVLPNVLAGREGTVEDVPIPANWHADVAEWAAVLRAVDFAKDGFTILELGCGWGCWLQNAGMAAARKGLKVNLVGVEGDEKYVEMAHTGLRANGFAEDVVTIHRGVIAAASGVALFPNNGASTQSYASEPIFGASEQQVQRAVEQRDFDLVSMLSLNELLPQYPRVDLLHVDIQGGEADLIHGCLPALGDHVAYLFIGTHSRVIEGRLTEDLLRAGWRLEIERTAIVELTPSGPAIRIDGVQGWRNMRLLPE